MSQLTDSFKPVDPAVYAFADQVLPKIQNKLWSGRVYDRKGNRLATVYQWLAAIERGEWFGPLYSETLMTRQLKRFQRLRVVHRRNGGRP